jgi:hypothetical protein
VRPPREVRIQAGDMSPGERRGGGTRFTWYERTGRGGVRCSRAVIRTDRQTPYRKRYHKVIHKERYCYKDPITKFLGCLCFEWERAFLV